MTPGPAVYFLNTKTLRKKKYTLPSKYKPKLDPILNKRMRVRIDSEEEGNLNEEEKKEGK